MTAKKGYIGIDAHARNSVMGWRDGRGKYQGAQRFETSESNLLKHLQDIPAQEKHLTIEEGPLAGWIARTLMPHAKRILICDPKKNTSIQRDSNKNDLADTEELSRLLWLNQLTEVYHPADDERAIFKAAVQQYLDLRNEQVRMKHKIKAKYRMWGVSAVDGMKVYGPKNRRSFLEQVQQPSIRHQLQRLYVVMDTAEEQMEKSFEEVRALGRKYPEIKEFLKIPGVGPVGSHVFDAFIQTPRRFANKQQVWRYSQLAIRDRSSDNKPLGFRRLDYNGNPELKAMSYWAWMGALAREEDNEVKRLYQASLERTHNHVHARLNTQRKIIAVMWTLWRKQEAYKPELFFLSPT